MKIITDFRIRKFDGQYGIVYEGGESTLMTELELVHTLFLWSSGELKGSFGIGTVLDPYITMGRIIYEIDLADMVSETSKKVEPRAEFNVAEFIEACDSLPRIVYTTQDENGNYTSLSTGPLE